ncbi:MAG: hypothetical protein RIC19_22675 [Phaeodactylibacter sp.]|uniref:hypothetical protein n=1 Tax=Phaeodactylibacter sp. TaxID=1940289 RepID=UPI0032EB70AA
MNRTDISRLRQYRSTNLKLGLILALGMVITAFNWTVEDEPPLHYEDRIIPDDLAYEVVRTQSAQPRPKPPQVLTAEVEPVDEPIAAFTPEPVTIDPPVISEPGPAVGIPEPVIYEPAPVPPQA